MRVTSLGGRRPSDIANGIEVGRPLLVMGAMFSNVQFSNYKPLPWLGWGCRGESLSSRLRL
jgi:hypothetical protein